MKQKYNPMLMQGAILAIAGIFTKIIGFFYRIPMANLLGEEGNGIYSVSFGIYNVALTLSSYSFPLAVSKLVSTRLAKKERKNAQHVFSTVLLFSIIVGICSFSLLFFGAEALESLYKTNGLAYPLKVLAPTTFIVSVLGVFRGYFQGHSNMIPTALSQIFEQIVNALVSILATFIAIKTFSGDAQIWAKGAAGATMGTLAGAVCALTFIILTFIRRMPYTKELMLSDTSLEENKTSIMRDLIITMIPLILSQTVYQISFTVDDLLFSNTLFSKGINQSEISALQGVFNTQYTQLINIPISISTAMSASALPAIINLSVKKDFKERKEKIKTFFKINMIITVPCAIGLTVFASPLIKLIFPSLITWRSVATNLLYFGSFGCVFYSLSTVTTSVLQGCNKMRIPVVNSFISFVLHTAVVFLLLKYTSLGIWARLIGDMTFPLCIAALNLIQLKRKTGFTLPIKKIFLYPTLASIIMGVGALAIYLLINALLKSYVVSLFVSVIFAVALYVVLILIFPVFEDDEFSQLPKGHKIKALSNKLKKQFKTRVTTI